MFNSADRPSLPASQPIQAYLFATELTLFQFWGDWLPAVANFWSLMFVMLAVFVAISYFALGWSSSTMAFVSDPNPLTRRFTTTG
jgi:hypothetical protein